MTTAISPSQVASIYGQQAIFKNLAPGGFALPQRIAVIGQGNTGVGGAGTKTQVFSAQEAGELKGFGSPLHEMVSQLLPATGDGVGTIPVTLYHLSDGTTASSGSVTPVGSPTADGTYFVKMNNLVTASFALASGASIADATAAITTAVNATLRLPATATDNSTDVDIDCKWQGLTGDNIIVSVEGPSAGMTFTVVQPTGGAGDPAIDSGITDLFGEVWETFVVQSLGNTTAALDALEAFNEGRWAATVSKPFVAVYGDTTASVTAATTVPDGRKTDRTNCQLVSPGSEDLPWAVAARELSRIALVANSASPASDYVRQTAKGLTPGNSSDQWTAAERDTAVKAGSSTVELRDGVVTLSDTVTFYHPTGDPTPAYRYVNDIVKLMNLLNDLRLRFDSALWMGAPLIPDTQATSNPVAKKPRMAVAEVYKLIDSWGSKALISDPAAAKDTVVAAIDSGNPRRLNIALTVQLSGNANVISADLNFGFFFGAV